MKQYRRWRFEQAAVTSGVRDPVGGKGAGCPAVPLQVGLGGVRGVGWSQLGLLECGRVKPPCPGERGV